MSNGILYPDSGLNGENILSEKEFIIKQKPELYSIRTDITKGKVKIVIPVIDDPENTWSYFRFAGMSVRWNDAEIINEQKENQKAYSEIHFLADSKGYADLPVYFVGHNTVEIKIFENGSRKPVRTKLLSW